MLIFEQVTKSLGGQLVLDGVSLTLDAGRVHFIVGRSGAGKSVLIRHAIGLLAPDAGRVLLDELEVSALRGAGLVEVRRRCQLVFQHATLFDSLDVAENIALPLRKRFGLGRAAARAEALRQLALVGCAAQAEALPGALGSGRQKLVAIARALALRPRYLLYDEPTTGLDPAGARRTTDLIRRLTDEQGLTAVVVSHDMAAVAQAADTVTLLDGRRVRFFGPRAAFVAAGDELIRAFVATQGPRAA